MIQNKYVILPDPPSYFLNRKHELDDSVDLLLRKRIPGLLYWGEAGVGKTTLACKLAYDLYQRQIYDAIIWTTAKTMELGLQSKFFGFLSKSHVQAYDASDARYRKGFLVGSLHDLYYKILYYSGYLEFYSDSRVRLDDRYLRQEVLTWMEEKRILLFIDDLDSWESSNWRYLFDFIEQIPFPSSVIITSRRNRASSMPGIWPIPIEPLTNQDARKLLLSSLGKSSAEIDHYDVEKIARFADGNPLIIAMIAGLIKLRTSFYRISIRKTTSDLVNDILVYVTGNENVGEFLYQDLYKHLSKRSQKVLLAIAVAKTFSKDITVENIVELSGVKDDALEIALDELETTSLINRNHEDKDDYDIHELTQQFLISQDENKYDEMKNKAQRLFSDKGST